MYLQIDKESVCLLTEKDKEMLSKYADGDAHTELMEKVYSITILAFMSGMKYVKENE